MRISQIKAAGFRGIRDVVEIHLPSGFAVITGRNGTGKSTLCDIVEFALTGTLERYASAKEDKESINDYLWWRGNAEPTAQYVTVEFSDNNGGRIAVSRTPSGLNIEPSRKEFWNAISLKPVPETDIQEGIVNLVRTTVLRDETITGFALDTTEPQRFLFTKAALGVTEFTELEHKVQQTVKNLKGRLDGAENENRIARNRVNDLIATASQLRTRVSQSTDFAGAENQLRELLADRETELPGLVSKARERLVSLKLNIDRAVALSGELREVETQIASLDTPDFISQLQKLEKTLVEQQSENESLIKESHDLRNALAMSRGDDPRLSDLAQLSDLGLRLGRLNGACPLCGSSIDESSFEQHVSENVELVQKHSVALNDLVRRSSETRNKQTRIATQILETREQLDQLLDSKNRLAKRKAQIELELGDLKIDAPDNTTNFERLERHISAKRNSLSELERVLALVETSRTLERLTSSERQVQTAQKHSDAAERQLRDLRKALSKGQILAAEINRLSGDIVDEQLAALSPLLSELFLRLRPHVSWSEVDYHLRGDVRRFLSFRVGEDLNPRFLFSSGQRRAAGLAFLLSVHLSRTWCRLRTLILDDPVQHIDDYRALHLVEVLSAIARQDHQIICTVEDPVLAELLCRRLRCAKGDGILVEMEYLIESGVRILNESNIYPLPEQVLLTA